MEPMVGGQAWVYRPQQPLSPHGTKHLALGSFKPEASYLLFTAHNTDMRQQTEETVRYLVPKAQLPRAPKSVRYTLLNRQTDPYTTIKADLQKAGCLNPDYAAEPLKISRLRDMAAEKSGEAFIAAHWDQYVALRQANLTLQPCPWTVQAKGEFYEITVKLAPPTVALVVIK